MEQTILTPAQKTVMRLVSGEPGLAHFYLTGGTALAAYYLSHRISDDLDFFVFEELDALFLHGFVERLREALPAAHVRFARLYDRHQFFFNVGEGQELKVGFTRYPFKQLDQPRIDDGLTIDSVFLGGELAKVRRVAALPKMLKPLTVEALKTFFADRARELAPEILQE